MPEYYTKQAVDKKYSCPSVREEEFLYDDPAQRGEGEAGTILAPFKN